MNLSQPAWIWGRITKLANARYLRGKLFIKDSLTPGQQSHWTEVSKEVRGSCNRQGSSEVWAADDNTPWEDQHQLPRNRQICSVCLRFQKILTWDEGEKKKQTNHNKKKKTFQFVKKKMCHTHCFHPLPCADALPLAAAATWTSAIFDGPALPQHFKKCPVTSFTSKYTSLTLNRVNPIKKLSDFAKI